MTGRYKLRPIFNFVCKLLPGDILYIFKLRPKYFLFVHVNCVKKYFCNINISIFNCSDLARTAVRFWTTLLLDRIEFLVAARSEITSNRLPRSERLRPPYEQGIHFDHNNINIVFSTITASVRVNIIRLFSIDYYK